MPILKKENPSLKRSQLLDILHREVINIIVELAADVIYY